jgi:hypothetical protein
MSYGCKSTLHHYHRGSGVAVSLKSTFAALMNPLTQLLLARVVIAIRASLACAIRINESEIDSTLPTHPL